MPKLYFWNADSPFDFPYIYITRLQIVPVGYCYIKIILDIGKFNKTVVLAIYLVNWTVYSKCVLKPCNTNLQLDGHQLILPYSI